LVGRVETAEVRWFGRSIVSVVARQQVLVLTTTGRRSGKVRRTTVAYTEVGGQIVVVGGAAGQTRPPDWVANLAADPLVEVTIRRATAPMRAMVLVGDARRRVWDAVLPRWPFIANYEARAGYEIAVVVLEPVPPG
jgi:deazaflavin-dependent oxidoreductase (nitroreductase family)